MWDESRATVLSKGMLFVDKARLSRAVRMYSINECCEIMVHESSPEVYKVICHRWFQDCSWMLRARKLKINMWIMEKYIGTHTCEMDTFNGNHFNLNVDLNFLILIPHIEVSIRYKIKEYITYVHRVYGCIITERKTFLGHKCAFEIVYGNWDKSFAAQPRYMVALQYLILRLLLNGSLSRVWEYQNTYSDKSDANGGIFPLAFAIYANESQETWTLFLNHLKEHIVKQRSSICLISDRHGDHQECKFRRRMELIRQEDPEAYHWLMRHELEKWTWHKDSGRRCEILTINMSESFKGLLKCVCGLPVTAMVHMSFKQMAERFVERSRGASSLMEMSVEFMPQPMK
ncbi:uncharacterized protein [Nicotiana sylvestris]|uniref:uncharacterized protein n=1 Tax=Nicotiana sylvestris TaxID=4096 RepID=UPI00388CE0D1